MMSLWFMCYIEKMVDCESLLIAFYNFSIDPMTGGPSGRREEREGEREGEGSRRLEEMTEEEKETEAVRLVEMMRRLNE